MQLTGHNAQVVVAPASGIYLDHVTGTMIDVGDNTMVSDDGMVSLTNNQVRIRGRAQGTMDWLNWSSSSNSASITCQIRWQGATDDGSWTADMTRPATLGTWDNVTTASTGTTLSSEWTVNTVGMATAVRVYRWEKAGPWVVADWPLVKPEDRLRSIIRSRCAPNVIGNSKRTLMTAADIREQRARDTLRRVVGESKFRDYQRKGFVTVRGKSGLTYQIFPSGQFTNVWSGGKLSERLCVVLRGDFPPTDSLIMRYLMILNNEDQFRSYAVKHGVYEQRQNRYHAMLRGEPDGRTLTEIYAGLKRKAA